MELTANLRPALDAACELAVMSARTNLAGTEYDPGRQPIYLALSAAKEFPAWPDEDDAPVGAAEEAAFITATVETVNNHLCGAYAEGDIDEVIGALGLSPRQIAALKARTVADTGGRDLLFHVLYGEPAPGDTRYFGAVPLEWRDPDNVVHRLIATATGWHPLADRIAAMSVLPALDLTLARFGHWVPQVWDSPSFLLRAADHLELVPAPPPRPHFRLPLDPVASG